MDFNFYKKPPTPKFGKLEPHYEDVYSAWKTNPDPDTNHALLTKVQPIIDTAVFSYGGKNASPNLKSQARVMALGAMKSYDHGRGNLRNHLLSNLQGLRRSQTNEQAIISVPERILLDQQHLYGQEKEFTDEFGRPPSTQELAAKTGLSKKRIGYIRSARQPVNSGRLLTAEGDVHLPGVRIPGYAPQQEAWHEFIYQDLDPIDQSIMERTFGLHGHKPIGSGELARLHGISTAAISQRKTKIQKLLDEPAGESLFGG